MARRFDFSNVESVLRTSGGVAETIEISHFWDQILDTYAAMKLALAPSPRRCSATSPMSTLRAPRCT